MIQRRLLLAAALAAPAVAPSRPRAQPAPLAAWPNDKPVEIIVPYPPGGGVDILARLVMPAVAERIPGMRTVVTNRAGAAGQIGLEVIFNAAPDGYTLGATTMPAHSGIPLERPARYRALDFTFLANIVEDPNCIYVRTDSPIRSLADFVAQARAKPGSIDYGTTGIGSDDHILMLEFEAAAKLPPLTHVPFAGSAPLIPQLLGGHIAAGVGNTTELVTLSREGKLRGLAIAATARAADLPELPTFRELGYEVVASAQRGIIGPPGLPPAITKRLEAAFRDALADPAFKAEMGRQFMPMRPLIGADYRAEAARVDAQLQELWKVRPWRG
jgi:tripartite-type tricarboxylate transporter receptor subunit TctC